MHVAADESFEALAVRELDVQHAAVRVDQRERIELARCRPSSSSTPKWPQSTSKRSPANGSMRTKARCGFQLRTDLAHILLQDAVAAAVAEIC